MAISLLDGTHIDVINVVFFKIKTKTFYNHDFHHYDEFFNDFIKNLNKITYVYVEYEHDDENLSTSTIEKHFLLNNKHHRLDGPAFFNYSQIYDINLDIEESDSYQTYFIDGKCLEETVFYSDIRVLKYIRKMKLKKLKIKNF